MHRHDVRAIGEKLARLRCRDEADPIASRILPPAATSRRQAKMIKNVKLVELPGGPHGVLWTHADRINSELISFLA